MNKNILSAVGFFVLFFVAGMGNIIAKSVSSVNSFYRAIGKRQLAVAMLYRKGKALRKENPELYNKIKDAEDTFKTLKSVRTYKDARILFVQADITKTKLADLPEELGISVGDAPVYLLFEDGKSLGNGAIKSTHGFLTFEQLRSFIDSNMSSQIEDYLDDKAERERQSSSRVYFGMGYPWYGYYPYHGGWGYPYWGYRYGYGPRVGFGVSFGI